MSMFTLFKNNDEECLAKKYVYKPASKRKTKCLCVIYKNLHNCTHVAVIGCERRVVKAPVLQVIVTSIDVPANRDHTINAKPAHNHILATPNIGLILSFWSICF